MDSPEFNKAMEELTEAILDVPLGCNDDMQIVVEEKIRNADDTTKIQIATDILVSLRKFINQEKP